MTKIVQATDFVVQLWVNDEMEIVIDLGNLSEVLFLHPSSGLAFGAVLRWIWEQNLVDNDVVDVDLLLGELDSQTLGFVH